jgi:cytochrome P450
MINWWALHYDPEWYHEPEKVDTAQKILILKFEPKRFLNHKLGAAEYAAMADVELRDHFAYGGGRRICPGLHVAEQSLFVNISRLLWGFNLEHAKDADGNDIPVDATTMGLSPGFLSIPKPFQCCMVPNCWRLTGSSYNSAQCTPCENIKG